MNKAGLQRTMLTKLRIENVRSIANLSVFFELPKEHGQWIILLGDNGSGKSTILRCLALALSDSSGAHAAIHSSKPQIPFVRRNADRARIEVSLGDDDTRESIIIRNKVGNEQLIQEVSWDPLFVVGYGSQRGSALGKGRYISSERPQDPVLSLFDESAELIRSEEWLQNLDYAKSKRDGRSEADLFQSVKEAVLSLLPDVKELIVEPYGVTAVGPDGRVPLSALSDGYLTTIGWVVDMMARWVMFENRGSSDKSSKLNLNEMTGIVLLDEIDLHLHPKWQVQVIDTLRSTFPAMTFVVTTHSPMTVLNAKPGELFVLRRDDDSEIKIEQRDIRPGMTADDILTGSWFEMSTTTDKDTVSKIEKLTDLVREGVGEDDPRRRRLERVLSERMIGHPKSSTEQIVRSVAAEILSDNLGNLSSEERLAARQKILQITEKRIGKE